MTPEEARWLARATALAANGLFTATPNPRVGCVIRRDGRTLGEGWHRHTGAAHAEVIAMQQSNGALKDAEVFVNLEPCAHVGRTPSCAVQLAAAAPARVIVAMPDPNPQVAGRGLALLRESGVEVVVAPPDSGSFQQALNINIGFASRMLRKRPWLRLKIAATLDGKTALSSGLSRWISGADSQTDAHRLRARSCALITGIGTALVDDPQLTVRHVSAPRQPLRVLVDHALQARPNLRLFANGALIVTAAKPRHVAAGVEVLSLPDGAGKVDLSALLQTLAERGVNEVTVEAGRRLGGAFAAAGLVDEIVLYQAPRVFGGGLELLAMPPPETPETAMHFVLKQCVRLGGDIKMTYEAPQVRRWLTNAAINAAV